MLPIKKPRVQAQIKTALELEPLLQNKEFPSYTDHTDEKCIANKKEYLYSPNHQYKAQSFIFISRDLTERVIPNNVRESIANIYEFINKSTAMIHHCGNALFFNDDSSIIYNYDFHHKQSGQILYCIADKVRNRTNHHQYQMRNKLYTKQDIRHVQMPPSSRCPFLKISRDMELIRTLLTQPTSDIACKTKWNRVRVFNAILMDNKQCKKQYNKQRLTLSIITSEFVQIIQTSARDNLIPIVMFNDSDNDSDYRVEYVQIIQIRSNVDVGVSHWYDEGAKKVVVSGIHLNKECIMNQHQLLCPNHLCHCLDGHAFLSQIDDLRIGNPDDAVNRYKDLKKRTDKKILELTKETQQLKVELQHSKANKAKQTVVNYSINIAYPPRIQIPHQLYRNSNHTPTPISFVFNTPQSVPPFGYSPSGYVSQPNTNTPTPNRSVVSSMNGMANLNASTGFPNTDWTK
eukprot:8015_1